MSNYTKCDFKGVIIMDKNDWISLKEKYPDMKEIYCSQRSRKWLSEKVLVQTKNGAYFIAECVRTRDFKWNTDEETWYSYGTGGRRMAVRNKVVAWMPLPEKYDGE
jgi:hypothetical protein